MRPLLVGEASNLPDGAAFRGRSGAFLAGLCGRDLEGFHAAFECVNLLPCWPGPAGTKGHRFPLGAARKRAARLDVEGRTVVLAGRRVAAAFGLTGFTFFRRVKMGRGEAGAWVIPHPSGIVRLWNDPAVRRSAVRLLGRLTKEQRRYRPGS